MFYPDSMFYDLIYSRLKGRMFEGFQRNAVDNMNWTEIRSKYPGVELQFGSGVPVSLLRKVMQISADPLFEEESIHRILIYTGKMRNGRASSSSARTGMSCMRQRRPI